MNTTIHQAFTQSDKMQALDRLASNLSVELGSVLSKIMTATNLLLSDGALPAEGKENIALIRANTKYAEAVVDVLSKFAGRKPTQPEILDARKVLSDLNSLLSSLLRPNIAIEMTHGQDIWPIKADLCQFQNLIVALAVNAGEAMPDGGRVHLRTLNLTKFECEMNAQIAAIAATDYVVVEVADTGVGIRADILDRIFEPFFSMKGEQGCGCGLSTAYGTIKQMNGHIIVESDVGMGTTFRILLPRYMANAAE
jgi:two-component system cell cycle sensor histidine kinase/response regulator CckA